jgi:D-proline reductase (dithiol) PrdB
MDDAGLRAYLAEIPVPSFPDPAWVTPRPLADATVGIVTTAGVHRAGVHRGGDERFALGDTTFRVFERDARDLALGHRSPSFDRIGFAVDINVVAPVDRLAELAADGTVGSVAPRHVSFVGSQPDDLAVVRYETGPQAATLLRDDGVDVVLLTPLGPMCTRTVCVLAHVLEAHGIATVALVSVERLAERMRPPRALYCEFPLGRPLGRPEDVQYQHDVLRAAFALLTAPAGPVLTTWPEAIRRDARPLACALPESTDRTVPAAVAEVRGLRSAYDTYRRTHGRTSVGLGVEPDGVEADGVEAAAAGFVRISGGTPWREAGLPANPVACALDLRTYYEESALALIDGVPRAGAAEAWFYGATATGAALRAARDRMREADAPFPLWYYLVTGEPD